MNASDLVSPLNDTSTSLTVFAPSNEAFADLLQSLGITAEEALANTELLSPILLYHVVPGTFKSDQLNNGETLPTLLGGADLRVIKDANGISIKPTGGAAARVISSDIVADNGIVHVVSGVLLPAVSAAPSAETSE